MAHRHGPQVVAIGGRASRAGGEVTAIVARQLTGLGVPEGDDVGRAALACARAFDSPQTSPSALAGLSRVLVETMDYLREREAT